MALSYVWGHKRSPHPCTVGGTAVAITENLDDALRNFRKHYPSSMLWVDINQADMDERALQVYMMVEIYRVAESIFAWRDKPSDEGKVRAGMALMQSLHDHVKAQHEDRVFVCKKSYWSQIDRVLECIPKDEGNDLWYACEGDHSFRNDPLAAIVDWEGTFTNDSDFPVQFRRSCGYDDKAGPVVATLIARLHGTDRPFIQFLQEMRLKRVVMQEVEIVTLTNLWDCQDGCWVEPWVWWRDLKETGTVSPELEMAACQSLVGDRCLVENPSKENSFIRIWGRGRAIDWTLFIDPLKVPDEAVVARRNQEHLVFKVTCYARRMAVLCNFQVAVLPAAAEVEDKIAASCGGLSLCLLRRLDGRSECQFVRECYVDGWMDGELVAESGEKLEMIVLV
ncbi:hypothetical protein BU25DRAFT_464542 [Macroventuria anomochaeta]|uniref:Uncharacterized protein n=1 Tax=Macroventuria anomochaeta TaxID=301207 RepID=A0ACB6SHM8_9PLEO|nr:uncharacterized protein BU25DRAFT_464542 [Macroventuria anomochaeta]KAF2633478.1 hypothetical protein BU25DRAFT_464542 [Macroventuria anomochaeta]